MRNPYHPSKALFTVTDIQGFTVILERNCWYGHILHGHPEMRRRVLDVKHAVLSPVEIHQNMEQARFNMVYYLRCPRKDPHQDYLKVSVWVFDPEGRRAIVTTAHPIVDIPSSTQWYQGKKRWPSSA